MARLLSQLKSTVSEALKPSLKIYQQEFNPYTDGRSPLFVSIGENRAVQKFIPLDEFDSIFGGFIRFRKRTNDDVAYIGVWGVRKSSRFRRVLRERGAKLKLLDEFPSNIRLASMSCSSGTAVPFKP